MELPDFKTVPVELVIVAVAVLGGIARYLNNFVNGGDFKFSIFMASIFVSGFGGLMFGLLGLTMDVPTPILLVMAGMGGHFSEQTLKFIYEIIKTKVK